MDAPLVTWIPAGSELVASFRIADLFREPATRAVVEGLFPAEKIEAFRRRTGIDPASLDELVFGKFSGDGERNGFVLIARGLDADLVVREVGARMVAVEGQRDQPFARRVGVLEEGPVDASAVRPDVMVVGVRAPEPTQALLAWLDRPSSAATSLSGEDATALLASAKDAPVALYVPSPIRLPEDSGLGLLLARERALGFFLSPVSTDTLRVRVDLRGEFPSTASANFRTLVTAVATSDMGRALGLEDGLDTLAISVSDSEVEMAMDVLASRFLQGVRLLMVADMPEMMGSPLSSAPGSAPGNTPGSAPDPE